VPKGQIEMARCCIYSIYIDYYIEYSIRETPQKLLTTIKKQDARLINKGMIR